MEDEDYDSDSTVLLTDFFDKPEKIDAKRRRLSNLHEKYAYDEEENTASDVSSNDTQTNGSPYEHKNNVNKNLLMTKYFARISEVKVEYNYQQNFSVTPHVTRQIPQELDSGNDRYIVRNAVDSVNDGEIICLDSDNEAQVDDETAIKRNENQIHGGYTNSRIKRKYGKLNVLKPVTINARRATTNISECNVLVDNCDDTIKLDSTKTDTTEVVKSSVITARRATTSFEENCTTNRIKPFSNEDKIPSERKRVKNEITLICRQRFQLNNNNRDNAITTRKLTGKPDKNEVEENIVNKKIEHLNNSDSGHENTEACKQRKSSSEGYKTKMLQIVDKQESIRLQDKDMIHERQDDEQTSEACDLPGTGKAQNQLEMREIIDEQEISIVPNEQVLNESHDNLHDKHALCNERNDEVMSESHQVQNKSCVQKEQKEELWKAVNKKVINESHPTQKKTKIHGEQNFGKIGNEEIINESDDKQEELELQNKQKVNVVPDEPEICNVRNEQETHESLHKQKITQVQGYTEGTCNEEVVNQSHHEQKETKLEGNQDINRVQDDPEYAKSYVKQKKYNVQNIEESRKQYQNRKTRDKQRTLGMFQDDDINRIHDIQDMSEVQDKENISEAINEPNRQVKYVQKAGKVRNKQETENMNDRQKTSEAINEIEYEKTRKVSPGGDNSLILKFQVNFFRVVKDFIKRSYPESELELHNLIQTLQTQSIDGIVQTDIQYKCPKCHHASTYSSNFLNNTGADENIANADHFRKCRLCETLTKLHISYMKRFKEKISKGAALNKIENTVATGCLPLTNCTSSIGEINSSIHATDDQEIIGEIPKKNETDTRNCKETPSQNMNIITEKDNTPAITKKRLSNEYITDSKRKKLSAKHDAQPLTSNDNQNAVPAITQTNNNLCDEQTNKVILVNVQDTTPKHCSGFDSERHKGGSKIESQINFIREPINKNTPYKLAHNVQSKDTNNMKVLDSNHKSKSKLIAVATVEECIEKENKKATDNVNEASVETSGISDGRKTRNVSHNEIEDVGTHKSGDNIFDSSPSERLKNENDSKPNMETRRSKENDNCNEASMKSLENAFTKLRNNANTEQIENKTKATLKNKTGVPVSASDRNNRPDIQSNSQNNKRTDMQYICPFCSSEYVHASKLLRHMRTNHNAKDTIIPENCIRRKCVFCNESMNNKNYNRHLKKYHPEKFTQNVATNENSDTNEDESGIMQTGRPIGRSDNEVSRTSESSSHRYHCLICEEILTTRYASLQHRKEKHPEFGNRQIYKKVVIHGKDEQDGIHMENDELDAEHNRQMVTDNENNNIDDERTHDITTKDSSKYKFHCFICNEILSNDYTSRQHRKEKHPDFRYCKIYKKVIIRDKDRDETYDSDDEELDEKYTVQNTSDESGDDDEDVTGVKKVNRHRSTNSKQAQVETHENVQITKNGANYNQHTRADADLFLKTTTNAVGRNNDGINVKITEASKYMFHCSICDEVLHNDYATRQHRRQKHPELRRRQIYKKVLIREEDEDDIHDDDNEELNEEDNIKNMSDESDDDGEVVTGLVEVHRRGTTNSKQAQKDVQRSKDDVNYNQNERAETDRNDDDINITITEEFKYKFHCSICDEILNNDYATRQHRRQKHPELRRRQIYKKVIIKDKEEQDLGEWSSSGCSDLDDNEKSSDGDENLMSNDGDDVPSDVNNEGNGGSGGNKSDDACNVNNMLNKSKRSQYVYVCALCKERFSSYNIARKHRIEKHLNMDRAQLITKILDEAATSNDQGPNKKDRSHGSSSFCDDGETEDTFDKSAPLYSEKERNGDTEAAKAFGHIIKNKTDRNAERWGIEKKESARYETKINEIKSTQKVTIEPRSDQLPTQHDEIEKTNVKGNSTYSETEEDESVKISESTDTHKKKTDPIMRFFSGEVSIQPNKSHDQEIDPECTRNTSNLKPTADKSETKNVNFIEKNVVQENINEHSGIALNCQENAKDSHVHKNGEASELAINGKNKMDILTKGTEYQDNDRSEIDLIDCFLDELDSKSREKIQIETVKDKDNHDHAVTESQISDSEIQNIEESHHTPIFSVKLPGNACLDNIKITNVTSIAEKLYIFICQECFYATDDYDTVIRHCQNHYNSIEDPVAYCQICQIKYDLSCFERHEGAHEKYLKSVKIDFSYKWLFADWQKVFENNDIVLTDTEDMQVKSIYKTFSVKMSVNQDGPWQTSLYLCCKCNTCVPPQDIESHVQQTCQFLNFPCSVCNYAFLTYDMRSHHEIYHKDGESKLFKIILFNDKEDERFNLKLFHAKEMIKHGGNQDFTDIFKCTCGLCFVSLKKLKLHFVECEKHTNNGIHCPDCTVLRQFLPTELFSHRSLHHGTAKYEFKVQRIVFQEETVIKNNSEAECNTSDPEKESELAVNEDLNVNNDFLKDEMLTQTNTEDGNLRHPKTVKRIEDNLTDKSHISEDESLKQNTNGNNGKRYPEPVEINEEAGKREMLKADSLTQTTNQEDSEKDRASKKINDEDLAVKRELLKSETLTQTTSQEDSQTDREPNKICEENLAVRRDLLKAESLTQTTNQEDSQKDQECNKINKEDLAFKRDLLKDETLTQVRDEKAEQIDSESRDMVNDESFRQNTNNDAEQKGSELTERNKDNLAFESDLLNDETLTNEEADQKSSESIGRNEESLQDTNDDSDFVESSEKNVAPKKDTVNYETLRQGSHEDAGSESVKLNEETVAIEKQTLNDEPLRKDINDAHNQSNPESVEFVDENFAVERKLRYETFEKVTNENERRPEPVEISDNEDDEIEQVDSQDIMDVDASEPPIPIDSDSDSDIEFIE